MDAPVTLLVSLWARPGMDAELGSYEDDVLALLDDHGAALVTRVRRTEPGDGPLETQVLAFRSETSLNDFLADPRRAALAEERQRCVARTEVTRVEAL